MSQNYSTQNDLLLKNLLRWYNQDDRLQTMLNVINGESRISLRIVDWFSTNYAKKNFSVYPIERNGQKMRFKVYCDYKLKLKAYSKKRFDPFCRWDRITIPYKEGTYVQTTIGQLNFFKWAIENEVIKFVEQNYMEIEKDMNGRNSSSRSRSLENDEDGQGKGNANANANKTRKKREELSISAVKAIKKEDVEIVVKFS